MRITSLAVAAASLSAAGCGSAGGKPSSSSKSLHGTLTVFGAGTLNTPFTAEIQAFRKQNPGVTVHSQFGASGDMVKAITQLHQLADVLAAGALDLDFIPAAWEDFDLILSGVMLPAAGPLIATLRDPHFQSSVAALGGYDITRTGRSEVLD